LITSVGEKRMQFNFMIRKNNVWSTIYYITESKEFSEIVNIALSDDSEF